MTNSKPTAWSARRPHRAAIATLLAAVVLLASTAFAGTGARAVDPTESEAQAVAVLEDMAAAMALVDSVAFTVDLYEAGVDDEADGVREVGAIGMADLAGDRLAATIVHGDSERDQVVAGTEIRYVDGETSQRASATDDWVEAAGEYQATMLPLVVDPGPLAERIVSFITDEGGWPAEHLGTRACGTSRCHVVRIELVRADASADEVRWVPAFEVLVDTTSGRLVQVDGYAAGLDGSDIPERRLRFSATFSAHDEPVTIEAPMP